MTTKSEEILEHQEGQHWKKNRKGGLKTKLAAPSVLPGAGFRGPEVGSPTSENEKTQNSEST